MPRSSNARFDENGFAEVVRDIEQLFMQLQDGTNDLNASADDVDNDNSEGGDTSSPDDTTPAADPVILGLIYDSNLSGGQAISTAGATTLNCFTQPRWDTLTGYDSGTGYFTAPTAGMYHLQLVVAVQYVGVNAGSNIYAGITSSDGDIIAGDVTSPVYPFSSATQTNATTYVSAQGIRRMGAGDSAIFFAGIQGSATGAASVGGHIAVHRLGAIQ